jgi:hypothetical protein
MLDASFPPTEERGENQPGVHPWTFQGPAYAV